MEGTTNVYPKNLEETLYLFGEKGTVKIGASVRFGFMSQHLDALGEKDLVRKARKKEPDPQVRPLGSAYNP